MHQYEQEIKNITERIIEEEKPEKIILFGSYATSMTTKDSDVDLFIVKKTTESSRERRLNLRRKLFGIKVPMDILIYTPSEVQIRLDLNDLFIKDIVNNGKLLYERK